MIYKNVVDKGLEKVFILNIVFNILNKIDLRSYYLS